MDVKEMLRLIKEGFYSTGDASISKRQVPIEFYRFVERIYRQIKEKVNSDSYYKFPEPRKNTIVSRVGNIFNYYRKTNRDIIQFYFADSVRRNGNYEMELNAIRNLMNNIKRILQSNGMTLYNDNIPTTMDFISTDGSIEVNVFFEDFPHSIYIRYKGKK